MPNCTALVRTLSLVSLCLVLPAQAVPVTAPPAGLTPSVLSFAPYDAVTSPVPWTAPVDVGQAQGLESVLLNFDGTDADRILGAVPAALGSNGSWPYQGAFAGLNASTGSMIFSFSRGMNFVGGYINFDPGAYDGTPTFSAFDKNGALLESTSLTFTFGDSGAVGQGVFLGFSRPDADIWSVRLENGEVVIDNLNFAVAAIPEPGTGMLALAGLFGLFCVRRRATHG